MRILIVEQGCDSLNIGLLEDILRECGASSVLCPTVDAARHVLAGGVDFDLVIFNAISVLMPANDLRRDFFGIPMVLISGGNTANVPVRREDLTMFLPVLGRTTMGNMRGITALLQLLEPPKGGVS